MDINFKLETTTFNYRVGALIKKDNYILLEYNTVYNYYSLIGGRVKIGEPSSLAIKREFEEETTYQVRVKKLHGLVENFFISHYANAPYHELLYIYDLEFINQELPDGLVNLEDSTRLFKWVDIFTLNADNFKPSNLLKYLNTNEFFHLINQD